MNNLDTKIYLCNASIQEVEARGSQVEDPPWLHGEFKAT